MLITEPQLWLIIKANGKRLLMCGGLLANSGYMFPCWGLTYKNCIST